MRRTPLPVVGAMIRRILMGLLAFGVATASIVAVARPDTSGGLGFDPEATRSEEGLVVGANPGITSGTVVGAAPSDLGYAASSTTGSGDQAVEASPKNGQAVLMVSAHAERASANTLNGSRLAGDAYIFLELTGESAQIVSFWIDRTSGDPDNTERQAPFDLIGGADEGSAKPLETEKLSDGAHSVKAMATLSDGSTVVTTATFEVANDQVAGSGSPATTDRATPTTSGKSTTTTTKSSKATPTTSAPKATTTTRSSSPTTISVSGDVRFKPGDNVESIVKSAPKGTVFVFSAGTYKGLSIEPKANQTFIGESGAVLDGNGARFAFRSGNSGITIQGLEITDYKPSSKDGVVHGGSSWTLTGNEIHHNGESGVHVGSGWLLKDNYIHHNGRYGINGTGDDIVISGNEISYNSTTYGASGESGGTKFVQTTGLVLRGNYVHHNYGNGLWVDINNKNPLVESNTLVSNKLAGVFIEISCGGTIRNNTVKSNGTSNPYPNWMAGSSGILVADSPGVSIYGNTLSGNVKGIGATQVDHSNLGAVSHCTPQLKNLDVHDNVITQSGGAAAGLDANNSQGSVWTSWGNKFHNNTYNLSGGAQFRWNGNWISYDQWKATGLS